ncbi:hypothetical protein CsSME_00013305 [Camellia sinensis var. sinensis]
MEEIQVWKPHYKQHSYQKMWNVKFNKSFNPDYLGIFSIWNSYSCSV